MKKQPMKKRAEGLKLAKETLRQLENPEALRNVNGASLPESCGTGCHTTYGGCCHLY